MKWTGHGAPPYGFEVDPDGTMFESDVEQAILTKIFQKKKNETLTSLAENLTHQGFETRNGKIWTRQAIQRALESNKRATKLLS